MPFGIASAPEFFQRCMEKLLQDLPGIVCLMDDILIYGENDNQHWKRVKAVLDRIKGPVLTLKKKNVNLAVMKLSFWAT